MTVLLETIDKFCVSDKRRGRHRLLFLLIAVFFALAILPSKAQAQIVGELEVNIPFQFQAGNTKLPAGKYLIHAPDNANKTAMEITRPGASLPAPLEVQ